MTKEQKIKILAELDGWKQIQLNHCPGFQIISPDGKCAFCDSDPNWYWPIHILPNYFASYDAIIPLIQKQAWHIKNSMSKQAEFESYFWDKSINLKPEQLSDALIKEIGQWEE